MYDLIVIGLGPAGMTAGIYAARREMKTLVIGKELGGQLIWASEIENYPGAPKIQSFDLVEKMRTQVIDSGAEIKTDEVKKIEKKEDGNFTVSTSRETFESSAVLICLGLSPRRLAIPGEVELSGKGVSYCANCDGPFYKGRKVVVVGGGNSALDAAEVLSKIASEVYLVHRGAEFRGFESLVKDVQERENIKIMLNSEIKEIIGKDKVEKVKIINNQDQSLTELELDGVFIEVGRIASTDLVGEFVERNEKNQIIINEQGETKTPGLFAAGDVTACEVKQITVATGQATIAALGAYKYLQSTTDKTFIDRKY
ncbi:FAD-dependent oxidoreductase [Patescibacteria group bacterium]|nr:FAD-dependent oxidoreductase [Patescibacteria group bacterium]